MNIKSKNLNSPNTIEVNKKMITDTNLICDQFNNYFSNTAEDILKTNKQPVLKAFDNPLSNSFVFEPCDPGEVKWLINELNPIKATGPNGIPTSFLQMISNIYVHPFE